MHTEFKALDVLKSALGEFFRDSFYRDAVLKLRKSIKEKDYYKQPRILVRWAKHEKSPLFWPKTQKNPENLQKTGFFWAICKVVGTKKSILWAFLGAENQRRNQPLVRLHP